MANSRSIRSPATWWRYWQTWTLTPQDAFQTSSAIGCRSSDVQLDLVIPRQPIWRFLPGMPVRISLAAFFAIALGFSQSPLTDFTFGGPGIDSARGVAVDSSGNIYVVGSTSSFGFPVLNAFQNANTGTQVIYSTDAGSSWKALASPFPNAAFVSAIAVDPKNSSKIYVASGNTV